MLEAAVLTPVQRTKLIITKVHDLMSSGKLNNGQANSITVKLDRATSYLNAGDTKKAINELNAFINEVNSYITNGILLSIDGQPLIDESKAIINEIE